MANHAGIAPRLFFNAPVEPLRFAVGLGTVRLRADQTPCQGTASRPQTGSEPRIRTAFCAFEPTKQEPLSDRVVAGAPNLPTARRSTATALSEMATPNSSASVPQREASSGMLRGLVDPCKGSFITIRSVCRTELGQMRSCTTHLRCLDFAGDAVTRSWSFNAAYTRTYHTSHQSLLSFLTAGRAPSGRLRVAGATHTSSSAGGGFFGHPRDSGCAPRPS